MGYKIIYTIIINNISCTYITSFPTSCTNKTRGNSTKIDKFHVLSARDGHSYVKHSVNVWNSLPDWNLLTKSVVALRHKINELNFKVTQSRTTRKW